MADSIDLIAMALLEQDGRRAMPLQGQSLREAIPPEGDPGDVGRRQAFELLLRIWQRSDGAPVRRRDGDTSGLIDGLGGLGAGRIWTLKLEPRSPLEFVRIR